MSAVQDRTRRAAVAAALIARQRDEADSDPSVLDWAQLVRVPSWALLDPVTRVAFERLIGAMTLAPMLCGWLDAARVDALCRVVDADALAVAFDAEFDRPPHVETLLPQPLDASFARREPAGFERALARAIECVGRCVLVAAWPADLPTMSGSGRNDAATLEISHEIAVTIVAAAEAAYVGEPVSAVATSA